jgi:hypothetical protein
LPRRKRSCRTARVLSGGALDLQQALIVRVVADVVLAEDHLTPGAAQRFQEQDLGGVRTRRAVGAEDDDKIDGALVGRVPQPV